MRVGTIAILAWLCAVGLNDVEAQTETITNASQIAEVFNGDVFCLPIDPPKFQAWLIDPQFIWADFASLPEQFGVAFAESQEQAQGVTVLKIRLTRSILTGETLVEFPSSTNSLTLAAPSDYQTNHVDSASRSSLQVWRQYIEWGALDGDTAPTLRLDVALADIQDKPAYDAALAAADAACAEASAQRLLGMQMEQSGGDEFSTESVTPCVSNSISTIQLTTDRNILLSWCSDAAGIYEIQSADSLTGVGAQGLQWVIRDNGYPSKGASTQWMDIGDPLWLSPILPPRFRQMRFYRIGKVGQALLTPSPTVTMQLTQTNAIIGDLYATVNVTLNDTNQQVSSVSVFVDGQKLIYTVYTNFTAFINSCEWPNGPHDIYAIATTVDSGETLPDCDGCAQTNSAKVAISVSPSLAVTFSNYISQLFVAVPFFNPAAGQTQQVVASFPQSTCWRLTVLDYQDTAVRHFANQTSSSLFVAWDGKDDAGNPLSFGFYDYFIEARPSSFGCPPSGMAASETETNTPLDQPSSATAKAGVYSRAAMRFSCSLSDIGPDAAIPDLSPLPSDSEASNSEEVVQVQAFGDATYSTRTPTRVPGTLFMGKAGYVGVGYQGHHPSSPNFALPNGGVVSLSHPPYGKLMNASVIANNFANVMAASAWPTSFNLGDDNFNSTNLFPVLGPGSGTSAYAAQCNFGLYVGHMTATANIDSDCACSHSWVPIYNSQQPGAYQWIGLPFMDLGKSNGSSPLKWMAFYGCDSLREQDWNDMWTKFVLPMPPNLRLLLGAEDGVFIHPSFGWQFAADMNGLTTPNNVPMTIVESWYDAARVADQQTARSLRYRFTMGTRRMTVAWRDDFEGGSWRTIDDSIWNWSSDISYDWTDIYLDERQVYP